MTKPAGLTEWETKLCKKLGIEYNTIEEIHKFLLKSLPMYNKMMLVVLPPLHSSLDFIHSNIVESRKEGDSDKAKNKNGAKLDPERCTLAILNAMMATLGPLGLSLTPQGSSSRGTGNFSKDGSRITNKCDFRRGNSIPNASNPIRKALEDKILSHSLQPVKADRNSDANGYSDFDDIDAQQLECLDVSSILANFELPPKEQRSPWVNSFIEKVAFLNVEESEMVHFLENRNDEGYTERNQEIIAYFMAQKLQSAFNLSDTDIVYGRFEAWLVRDVLLQGRIFILRDALCFYLLLPGKVQNPEDKDPDTALHEGALGHSDFYFSSVINNKGWAILRPRTLSLYSGPSKVYFPLKVIDLKNAIHCRIVESTAHYGFQASSPRGSNSTSGVASPAQSETCSFAEEQEEAEVVKGVWFEIVCTNKVYKFQTQGIYSARHWVTALTKAIFTLRNTNSNHEAILKVPLQDVLDYRKKFILRDEDEVSGEETEEKQAQLPVTISLSYTLPAQEVSKNLEDFHMKPAIDESVQNTSDSANFLLFHKGEDLFQLLDFVYDNHMKSSAGPSAESSGLSRTVLSFSNLPTSYYNKVTSTLQPEFSSGTSIMNKIESVNREINKYRHEQNYRNKNGKIVSLQMKERTNSTSKKIVDRVRRVLALSDRLFAHASSKTADQDRIMASEVSDVTFTGDAFDQLDENELDSFDQHWEEDFIVNLPKPFTLLTLKNSGMHIRAQRRNINEVILRYLSLINSDGCEEEKRIDNEWHNENTGNNSPKSTKDSRKKLKKSSKMNVFKKSIKTVSAMGILWSTMPEHFIGTFGDPYYVSDLRERVKAVNRFRKNFSLGPDSVLISSYFTHLKRIIPIYGLLYVSNDKLCFRSLLPGVSTKMILPLREIQLYAKGTLKKSPYFSEHIKVKGMDEVVFEFGNSELRNDFHETIKNGLGNIQASQFESLPSPLCKPSLANATVSKEFNPDRFYRSRIRTARLRLLEDKVSVASGIGFPLILEDDPVVFSEVVPMKPLNIILLTIGSRGDVQPYIALGKALIKEGHNVTIATHAEYADWIVLHGIQHKVLAGDPAELMQLMVTHGSLSVSFLREAHAKFKEWILLLLETSWTACEGADLIIESPSAMSGIHIAEALGVPYIRAFTMPWTRSRAYPHAFIFPDQKRSGSYNLLTHIIFENIFWKGISGQVNAWREKTLGLARTNLHKLQQYRVPFIYNVSPAILPPSVDFPEWVKISGYWFLDEGALNYKPPAELMEFIERARQERKTLVYVGFGSIVVSDANALTQTIVDAILELEVLCILNKGWSDRLSKAEKGPEIKMPPVIFECGSVPHDWLFPKVDVAIHHGGSGTTGASLRAGTPTIIKPFFGDQFFYASRIEEFGAGICLKTLNAKILAKAIRTVTTEKKYKQKVQEIASAMLKERGVMSAVEAIYTELAYAKSLILNIKHNKNG